MPREVGLSPLLLIPESYASSVEYCALRFFLSWSSVYIVCLFISYASPLILFSSLFPDSFPPLLIFSFENRPAPFRAGCRKRRLNLALVFFCVVVHFFWLVNVCLNSGPPGLCSRHYYATVHALRLAAWRSG